MSLEKYLKFKDSKQGKTINWVIALLSIAINLFLLFRHEFWRDEAQAWLIARDTSPIGLFDILSYEGHPMLWYLVLMPFAKLNAPVITLKLISFVIVAIAILIFNLKAPFDIVSKSVVSLCPLFLYCFSTISRSYSLCVLFVILLAWLYKKRASNAYLYSIVIALMIQTHVAMITFAFFLCAGMFFESIWNYHKSEKKQEDKRLIRNRLVSLIIPFASALLLLYELRDVSNAGIAGSDNPPFSFIQTFDFFISILKVCYGFGGIIILWLLLALVVLQNKRIILPTLIFVLSEVSLILLMLYAFGAGQYRYLIAALLTIWYLWVSLESMDIKTKINKISVIISLVAVMIIGIGIDISNSQEMLLDIKERFSLSQDAAEYIKEMPEDTIIIENSEDFCNAVVLYLDKGRVISPFTFEDATYANRKASEMKFIPFENLVQMVKEKYPDQDEFYLLYSYATSPYFSRITDVPTDYEVVYMGEGACIRDEVYIIFRIPIK